MSKLPQRPTASSSNTAEDGCGNGFSLVRALSVSASTGGHLPYEGQRQQQQPATNALAGGLGRLELLNILNEALHIVDEMEEDDPEIFAGNAAAAHFLFQ